MGAFDRAGSGNDSGFSSDTEDGEFETEEGGQIWLEMEAHSDDVEDAYPLEEESEFAQPQIIKTDTTIGINTEKDFIISVSFF